MINPELLQILCCPETRQSVSWTNSQIIDTLNQKIAAGELCNRAGKIVSQQIDGGLMRADGKVLYPVRGNIPVMLVDEAIPVE